MAQVWPITLQDRLNEESFGIDKGDTLIRSDMDVGPQKVRRRFTKGIDTISGSITLTTAQYNIFESFYDTTLNGGALTFEYNHPVTEVLTEFRFKGAPQYKSIGGGNYVASFAWEIVP